MRGHVLRDQQRLVLTGLADCCRVRGDGTAWEAWVELRGDDRWRGWEHDWPAEEIEAWLHQPADPTPEPEGGTDE